jgi:hypothetical protein
MDRHAYALEAEHQTPDERIAKKESGASVVLQPVPQVPRDGPHAEDKGGWRCERSRK